MMVRQYSMFSSDSPITCQVSYVCAARMPMVHRHSTHRWLLPGYRRHQCLRLQSTLESQGQQPDAQFHVQYNCTYPDRSHRHTPRQYVQVVLGVLETPVALAALVVLLHQ